MDSSPVVPSPHQRRDSDRYCQLCAAWFNNPMMAQQHYDGKKHKKNAARADLLEQLGKTLDLGELRGESLFEHTSPVRGQSRLVLLGVGCLRPGQAFPSPPSFLVAPSRLSAAFAAFHTILSFAVTAVSHQCHLCLSLRKRLSERVSCISPFLSPAHMGAPLLELAEGMLVAY